MVKLFLHLNRRDGYNSLYMWPGLIRRHFAMFVVRAIGGMAVVFSLHCSELVPTVYTLVGGFFKIYSKMG